MVPRKSLLTIPSVALVSFVCELWLVKSELTWSSRDNLTDLLPSFRLMMRGHFGGRFSLLSSSESLSDKSLQGHLEGVRAVDDSTPAISADKVVDIWRNLRPYFPRLTL